MSIEITPHGSHVWFLPKSINPPQSHLSENLFLTPLVTVFVVR